MGLLYTSSQDSAKPYAVTLLTKVWNAMKKKKEKKKQMRKEEIQKASIDLNIFH